MVASELATNAVQHAGTPFSVTVDWACEEVTLRVPTAPTASRSPVSRAPLELRGRGLLLVDALSVAWGASAEAAGGKSVHELPDRPRPELDATTLRWGRG